MKTPKNKNRTGESYCCVFAVMSLQEHYKQQLTCNIPAFIAIRLGSMEHFSVFRLDVSVL